MVERALKKGHAGLSYLETRLVSVLRLRIFVLIVHAFSHTLARFFKKTYIKHVVSICLNLFKRKDKEIERKF